MANKTISDLTTAITVNDTDVLLVENEETTMKVRKEVLLEECSKIGHTHIITDIESLQERLDSMLEDIKLADVAISGSYTDLIDTPNIPLNLSELENDMNYATQSYVANKIAEAQLNGGGGGTGGSGVVYNEYYESLTINSVQSINYDESNERLNIN